MSTVFDGVARSQARVLGVPEIPVVIIPHPFGDLTDEQVQTLADRITPIVVEALTTAEPRTEYRDPILASR